MKLGFSMWFNLCERIKLWMCFKVRALLQGLVAFIFKAWLLLVVKAILIAGFGPGLA
jgi:hypothetical protein